MSEYKNLKIDDVYVFYFHSGYVGGVAEDELTVGEIVGVETQEELNALSEDYIEGCFECEYEIFISNQDAGWRKK